MRRAIVTGTATVSGVVLLLGLKPHSSTPIAAKGADNNFTITQSDPQSGAQPGGGSTPSPSPSSSSSSGSGSSAGTSSGTNSGSNTSGTSGTSGSSGSSGSSGTASQPSAAPSTSAAPKPAAPSTSAAPVITTKTVTGNVANTRYGPVQLAVTFTGKKITRIQVLQYPTGSSRDQEINSSAIPQLNQQAMSAQSANIDGVSGATYTSQGYQQSLQSAIDKAGV